MHFFFTLKSSIKLNTGIAAAFCLLLSFTAGSGSAMAQNVTKVDTVAASGSVINLTQAIQIALANNVQIQRALLSIKDADQQVRGAWSGALPEVTASANYTRNLEVPVNFIPEVVFNPDGDPNNLIPVAFGTDNNWSGGLTVSQTLFDGEVFVGISSSKLFKTVQAESLRVAAQQVVTQTRLGYYQVLIAKEQVNLLESQINRISENLDDTRAQYKQGLVDNYAVLQLEVQLGNLRPQLTQARYDIDEARRNLLDIMGLPLSLSLNIAGDLGTFKIQNNTAVDPENKSIKKVDRLTPVQFQPDSLLMQWANNNRGDLRVIDLQQQLQKRQIKANKSQYLPTLSASYNLQYNAAQSGRPIFFGTEEQRARSQTLILSLSLPIFQGFERDVAVQQAKIQLQDLQLVEYQAEKAAHNEIITAEENIREVYETATARRNAVDQAQRGYDRAILRYENGLGSQEEITDAQLQLREAERNYAQMVFDYLSAKAQYDRAVGLVPFVDQDPDAVREDMNSKKYEVFPSPLKTN